MMYMQYVQNRQLFIMKINTLINIYQIKMHVLCVWVSVVIILSIIFTKTTPKTTTFSFLFNIHIHLEFNYFFHEITELRQTTVINIET